MHARTVLRALALTAALGGSAAQAQSIDLGDVLNFGVDVLQQQDRNDRANDRSRGDDTAARARASRAEVREIQRLLQSLGYEPGPADGRMGRNTRRAIREFETDAGLPVTERPSPALLAKLRAATQSGGGFAQGAGGPGGATAGGAAGLASFDCAKAGTAVETAICADGELGLLDLELADAYQTARESAGGARRDEIRDEQRAWVARRDQCGADQGCLADEMRDRIVALDGESGRPSASFVVMDGLAEGGGGDGAATGLSDNLSRADQPIVIDGRYAMFYGGTMPQISGLSSHQIGLEQNRLLELIGIVAGDPRFTRESMPTWTGEHLGVAHVRDLAREASNGDLPNQLDYLLRNQQRRDAGWVDQVRNSLATDFDRRRFDPLLSAAAFEHIERIRPPAPLPVRVYCGFDFERSRDRPHDPVYDFDNASFRVVDDWKNCGLNAHLRTRAEGGLIRVQGARPAFVSMPPHEAESLLERMGRRRLVLGVDAELSAAAGETRRGEPTTEYAITPVGAYRLYFQDAPQQAVYAFSENDFEPEVAGSGLDAGDNLSRAEDPLVVGGRYAFFEQYGLPNGLSNDWVNANKRQLLELFGLVPDDPRVTAATMPLWAGEYLSVDVVRELAHEASNGEPPDQLEYVFDRVNPLTVGWIQQVRASLASEFDQRRFDPLVRAAAYERIEQIRPAAPLPVRLFCKLRIDQVSDGSGATSYDFDNQRFEVGEMRETCDAWSIGLRTMANGQRIGLQLDDAPRYVSMAPEAAEQFIESMANEQYYIVFDAEVSAVSAQAENGDPVTRYTIQRSSGYQLTARSEPTRVIYEFAEPDLAPPPLTEVELQAQRLDDLDRPWLLNSAAEQEFVLGLAAADFHYDEAVYGTDALLRLRLRAGLSNRDISAPADGVGLSDAFRQSGEAVEAARRLGRPAETVFDANIGAPRESPIEGVLIATQHRLADYARPAPSSPGEYRVATDFLVAGATLLELGSGKPHLMLFARPSAVLYFDGRGGVNVERDAPIEEIPILAPDGPGFEPVTLARPRDLALAAAQGMGADARAVMARLAEMTSLDAFERKAWVEALVATAEPADLGAVWLHGDARLGDYDADAESFALRYVSLGFRPDLPGEVQDSRFDWRAFLTLADGAGIRDVRIAMPFAEAEAFDRRLGDRSFPARFLFAAAPPSPGAENPFPLQARVVEMHILAEGADPSIIVESQILRRVVFETSAAAAEPVASEAAAPAVAFDMLGVRLRAPFAEQLAALEPSFAPEAVYYSRRDLRGAGSGAVKPTSPLVEATVLARSEGRDQLAIYHEPLLESDPVTAIVRTILFEDGARPTPAAFEDLLSGKYGAPSLSDAAVKLWWTPAPSAPLAPGGTMAEIIGDATQQQATQTNNNICFVRARTAGSSIAGRLEADRAHQTNSYSLSGGSPWAGLLVDDEEQIVSDPPVTPLWAERASLPDANCQGDMLMVVLEIGDFDLVHSVRMALTNRAGLIAIEEQAKQSVQREQQGAAPKIDL